MGKNKAFKNPSQIEQLIGNGWFEHYYTYLTSLAYQMFEWKNLPDSVDPRYMEMSLHELGFVGFYKDPNLGYIAVQGNVSGTFDHYNLPTHFHAIANHYQATFPIYRYSDMKDFDEEPGVVIWNNDYHFSTLPSLEKFARSLAHLKEVIWVNLNAQKTPVLILADDNTKFSMMQMYNQYSGNSPVIFGNKNIDPEAIKVLNTDAPYVADKLDDYRNSIWAEVMTYLGIKNSNIDKKERLITDEVNSNDEQVTASSNVFLKAREEAAKRINDLYGLNISVEIREDIVMEIASNIQTTGGVQNE